MLPITAGAIASSIISTPSWSIWNGSKDGSFTSLSGSGDTFGVAKLDTDRSLFLYANSGTGQINAVIATTSGTTITYHTSQVVDILALYQGSICTLDTGRALVCYVTAAGVYGIVLSIDGSNNITVNTRTLIHASVATGLPRVLKLAADQCIFTYIDSGVSDTFSATCVTTTGTAVDAPHAILEIDSYVPVLCNIGILSSTSAFVAYSTDESGNGVNGIVLTIASNTVSKFSPHNLVSSAISIPDLLSCETFDSTHAVVVYEDYNAALCKAFVVTITDGSGNMTAGSSTTFYSGNAVGNINGTSNPLCFIDSATLMVLFSSFIGSDLGLGCVLSISGTTINSHNAVTLYNSAPAGLTGILLDSNRIVSGATSAGIAGTQVLSIT